MKFLIVGSVPVDLFVKTFPLEIIQVSADSGSQVVEFMIDENDFWMGLRPERDAIKSAIKHGTDEELTSETSAVEQRFGRKKSGS